MRNDIKLWGYRKDPDVTHFSLMRKNMSPRRFWKPSLYTDGWAESRDALSQLSISGRRNRDADRAERVFACTRTCARTYNRVRVECAHAQRPLLETGVT